MEHNISSRRQKPSPGDEIVISGLSGKFPNAKNVAELSHNLYNKIDMVDARERRWPNFHPEIPYRMGTIDDIEKFDALFFGVGYKQSNTMDPQCRLLIETAYEAIMDAGICPKNLRGTNTGVYIGACFGESEKTFFYDRSISSGLGITGCSRAMLANRVSYCLGLNGPSYLIDTACSSSMYALDVAFSALRNGECDAALVGGSNVLLHPFVTLQFARLGVLAKDGFCRPFDNQASGYTRSEAICVILLQKAKNAKRIYANVLYSKTNCDGFKTEGITYPSGQIQEKLLTEFYNEIDVDPSSIMYVEAHSTGTVVGDPEECRALDKIFCKNRSNPLLVGSMKSNIGHTESSSGVCSIAKVILTFETGFVPPNVNFISVRKEIPALNERRLIVCTENTPFEGECIPINSFGFGGANAHGLLSRNKKEKVQHGVPKDNLARLVLWSGRTEQGVQNFLQHLEQIPLDMEFVGLLHSTQSLEVKGNIYRGYSIVRKASENYCDNAACVAKSIRHYDGIKRPIVWMFSGMGSQWTEMGAALMELPVFRESIHECHAILQPFGVNLISILSSKNSNIFDRIVNSFVGIAAIQIGLVKMLKLLELPMDFCIGHSVGELGCSYADGSLSATQMILAAYARGLVSRETNVIDGSMAVIGLGFQDIRHILPPSIDAACHNNAHSTTISGPKSDVAAFVAASKQQGIFAKEVLCSNIPYHSKYITEMGPSLLSKLREIIPTPMKRSPQWLSTSVPANEWDVERGQLSSPEYHTNNLLRPVLFEETAKLLPSDAIVLEIAPHGLLQAIVKKSMPNAVHIPLTQRGHPNNVEFLLNALGSIFTNGHMIPIERLYPPVEFPVSRGTPMISPLLEWDHTVDYFVSKFEFQQDYKSGERRFTVAFEDHPYLSGHVIDGRCILPATYYLELVWETFSMMTAGPIYANLNVEFEDMRFLRATAINVDQEIDISIVIHRGSGRFEISESSTTVVTGFIRQMETDHLTDYSRANTSQVLLKTTDFYKELRLRGYHYHGVFRSVEEANHDVSAAKIRWHNNWTALMDCMLQLNILGIDSRFLYLPTRIRKLRVDAKKHLSMISMIDGNRPVLDAFYCPILKLIKCGGIEIFEMTASSVERRKPAGIEVFDSYQFVPLHPYFAMDSKDILKIMIQLVLENTDRDFLDALEIHDEGTEPIIGNFNEIIRDTPLVTMKLNLLTNADIKIDNVKNLHGDIAQNNNYLLTIANDCAKSMHNDIIKSTSADCFVLLRQSRANRNIPETPDGFKCISVMPTEHENFVLLRKLPSIIEQKPKIIMVSSADSTFEWINVLKEHYKKTPVLLVAFRDKFSGLVGLVKCLRQEPGGNNIKCILIDDHMVPSFSYDHPLYKAQLQLGLAFNIYQNSGWGTYRFLGMDNVMEEQRQHGHVYANVERVGDLSSFRFYNGRLDRIESENRVYIHYAAINFRDVMLATGRLPREVCSTDRLKQETVLGFEYAGVDRNGDRVMGMSNTGSMATQMNSIENLTWFVPAKMSLRDAATIPVVYTTVYYAFFVQNPITKGKSILIHAGSGGVGLAAIRVALAYGLEVFTTVSNIDKKKFILGLFPELKEENIGNSRDCSFEQMIMVNTRGLGVDYVLNSLSEEKLLASVRCLGLGGCFLEIGKFDITNDLNLGLGAFNNETSFRAVFADNLILMPAERKIVHDLIEKDLEKGIIQPLYSTVFQVDEIENAYRYLSTGRHVGKVLIQIRETEQSKLSVPLKVHRKLYCDAEMVYVLVGGLGGFGLELADWLVLRGARKLVLNSRRGVTNAYQGYRIRMWESYGCQVIINVNDVTTYKGCKSLLIESVTLGAIGGIFNLAAVLFDGILDNQTPKRFGDCVAPKAGATFHLDQLSRLLCPQLEHFVVFSSASCGRGNAGQSNYGLANAIMERIIEQRIKHKLPGKAIQWGAIGDVGLVADMFGDKLEEIAGTLPQRIAHCTRALDTLLMAQEPIVSSMVLAEKQCNDASQEKKITLVASVLKVMGIRDLKTISPYATLAELGMDSLMSVEIKQILEREFEVFLTSEELRLMTFGRFQELSDTDQSAGDAWQLKELNKDELYGFNFLFRNFGNELSSGHDLLEMKTNHEAQNGTISKALIIPGVEGVASSVYNHLSNGIQIPISILQLMQSYESDDIHHIVQSIIDKVKAYFASQPKFYIIAHSFGAIPAIEIARILEANGQTGHILLIDGAPMHLCRLATGLMRAVSGNNSSESLENILIMTIFDKLSPMVKSEVFQLQLSQKSTWLAKVDLLLDFLPTDVRSTYSEAYLRKIVVAILNRVKAVFKYGGENNGVESSNAPKHDKLKSKIILVRPSLASFKGIADDYELSSIAVDPVIVRIVDGDHFQILENDEIINIINEFTP